MSWRYSCGGTGTDPMEVGWASGMPGSTTTAAWVTAEPDCMEFRPAWLTGRLLWVTGGLLCGAPGPSSISRGLGCVVAGLGWGAGGLGWATVGLCWAAGLDWVWGLCFWATMGLCFSDVGAEWAPFTSRAKIVVYKGRRQKSFLLQHILIIPSSGMMCKVTVSPASLISLTISAWGMLMIDWQLTAIIRSPTFSFPQRSAGLPSMIRPILCGTATKHMNVNIVRISCQIFWSYCSFFKYTVYNKKCNMSLQYKNINTFFHKEN